MKKEVSNSVNSLIGSGFADIEPADLFTAEFHNHDLWRAQKHKFSPKTVEDIEKIKSTNTIYEFNKIIEQIEKGNFITTLTRIGLNPTIDNPPHMSAYRTPRALDKWGDDVVYWRYIYVTKYIGVTLDEDTPIEHGVRHMSKILTDLSNRDLIKGNLAPLNCIYLANKERVIVSYLLFDDVGIKYLEDNKIDFHEGGMPPRLP